jgi:transposase InsO family protein
MRRTAAEKMEIIRIVESSAVSIRHTLRELDVPRRSFYRWYRAYRLGGFEALKNRKAGPRRFWNRIPEAERKLVVETALERPEDSPRQLAWHITDTLGTFISESSVYRILKDFDLVTSPTHIVLSAKDRFDHPTQRVHELWQTDFTYLRVIDWGWYYLATILDDFSRYVIAWDLRRGMAAKDVTQVLDQAVERSGVEGVPVHHRPRLLSDNGSAYISSELRAYLEDRGMTHTRGRPYHPMTQGKIERYHRSMKNVVTLRNYTIPQDLDREISRFVEHYNHERVHESLGNLTPADVYKGRGREIRTARWRLKRQTLSRRRRFNRGLPARKEELIRPAIFRECLS